MADYEYTCGTTYGFTTSCTTITNCFNPNLQTLGVYSQSKIEDVLLPTDKTWTMFTIPEVLDLPTGALPIDKITSVYSCIDVVSQSVVKTPTVTDFISGGIIIGGETIPNSQCTTITGKKLVIELLLTEKISYISTSPTSQLYSATFKFPYSTFIIVDEDTTISNCFKISSYIINVCCSKLSETNIFKSSLVFIKAE